MLSNEKKLKHERDNEQTDAFTYSVGTQDDHHHQSAPADGVFGTVEEGDHDYRTVTWIKATALLLKSQIGLGVLGIPSLFSTIGLVPGLIVLITIAALTTYSTWLIGRFKVKHPEVHSIADFGYMMGGPIGRELLGGVFWLYMICSASGALLSLSIAFNAITLHATCTVVWVVIAAVVAFLFASIQTLHRVSAIGWIGLVSIFAAVITCVVAVAVRDRPALAPPAPEPFNLNIRAFHPATFAAAANQIGSVLFAYGAVPASFTIVAEMKDPRDFKYTAIVAQSVITATYIALGVSTYMYTGDYIASPALGSAGPLMKRVCYGLALPALFASAILLSHFPSKYMFVRILRGTRHLTKNTITHWVVWLGCTGFGVLVAFIIAEAIPSFNGLLGLIGSLLGGIMSLTVMGMMWFYDNWSRRHVRNNLSFKLMVLFNVCVIVVGLFITVAGSYGSVVSIIDLYNENPGSSFSCADNSS
ncbi:hypothetical protein ACM66B_003255 [Microbotryomycetes sp. NB124-2]